MSKLDDIGYNLRVFLICLAGGIPLKLLESLRMKGIDLHKTHIPLPQEMQERLCVGSGRFKPHDDFRKITGSLGVAYSLPQLFKAVPVVGKFKWFPLGPSGNL